MGKKAYQKPEIKEVKLSMQDTLLGACRASRRSGVNPRAGSFCSTCNRTWGDS